MSQSRHTIIPSAAIGDMRLTATQLRVLMAIGSFTNKDFKAWPRQKTIADLIGIARETVNRAVKVLKGYGYIEVLERNIEGKGQVSKLYFVKLDPCDPTVTCDATITPPVTARDHTPCDRTASQPYELSNELSNEDKRVSDEKQVFDFYNQTAKAVGWVIHSKLTNDLRKHITARCNEHGLQSVLDFIKAMSGQKWTYQGFAQSRSFRATLTYLLRPRTFTEHFDKLVTAQPQRTVKTAEQERHEKLTHCFDHFAQTGQWIGSHYGFTARPDFTGATYPAELYRNSGVQFPDQSNVTQLKLGA